MVQFITHYTDTIGYLDSVKIALAGGCRWIQLRMKGASIDEIRPIALEAQRLCHEADATFIIDDHVELVKEIGADGVHLGKMDMPIDQARAILGDGYIIGGTANTVEDLCTHVARGANYIGCGPYRFTTTKDKLAPVLGLDGYRNIVGSIPVEYRSIPIVAIGGITVEDIPDIMATGVSGIAISGSVLRAQDPVAEMKKMVDWVEGLRTKVEG